MMPRVLFACILLALACDTTDPAPRGGAHQRCDNSRCNDASLACFQISGGADSVDVCLPTCSMGDTCAAPPDSSQGRPTSARCNAETASDSGFCVTDCKTADDCPDGQLCFYDEFTSPATMSGACALPPP